MKYFCLPADFKKETIDEYNKLNQKYSNSKITETYGQLAPNTFLGSGRNPKELPQVDIHSLEAYVKYSNEKEIQFNYVINGTCMDNDDLTRDGYLKIKTFLMKLQDIGVHWVTIAIPSIMEIAREVAPKLKIKASTLCQINSPMKAAYYEQLGIERIVLDEDINRKFDVLKNIRKVYSGEVEVIVNSNCIVDCPLKMFHFNSFSRLNNTKDIYPYYDSRCMALHLKKDNYLKLNWIRPEDIHYYSEMNINFFKLQGRTNVYNGNPVKAVSHYIEETYDGNLLSLLELFSDSKPFTISDTSIDNRKLDGFLEVFVKSPAYCTKVCQDCVYCESYANKSINAPNKILTDEQMTQIILGEYLESMREP